MKYTCKKHPDRPQDGARDKCWECLIGLKNFVVKFGTTPEKYYKKWSENGNGATNN
jgi:hypothetical protein